MAVDRKTQRRSERQWRYREVEAIDQILGILDSVAIHGSWRAVRRVLFYVLLLRWERLGKAINLAELES
jgi:hypothetical protein